MTVVDERVPRGNDVCEVHRRLVFQCQDAYVRTRLTMEEIDRCLERARVVVR